MGNSWHAARAVSRLCKFAVRIEVISDCNIVDIKCLYKKKDAPVKVEQTPDKKLKNVKAGLEEMSSDDEGQKANTAEYIATQPFKDLYKQSPII